MSDTPTTDSTATKAAPAQEQPPTPAQPETDWKAEARKWEARAKENTSAREELDRFKQAQMTELEKAQQAAAQAQADVEAARVEALRYRIAAQFGINEHTDLILTGADEDTMTRQAELWASRTPSTTHPKPDPAQGARDAVPLNGDPLLRDIKQKLGIA